ncbi:MAG TPA: hypothetical protein VK186_07180, partial [Candidatus Deferrimicrobium sp.]|nr:hypothetical protein [Candidatus Deferrimicrobium sp.]
MKIAIISTSDNYGGASIAANRLHKGLRSLNQDSAMLVRYKRSNEPGIIRIIGNNREMKVEEKIFKT